MGSKAPSYITHNRFGIFIFQYRFPLRVRQQNSKIPILFKRSLRTRSKRNAEKEAKRWWFLMDELTLRIQTEPDLYGRAVTLLRKYQNIEHLEWSHVEAFLSELTDAESAILESIIKTERKTEPNAPTTDPNLDVLQQILETLKKQQTGHTTSQQIIGEDQPLSVLAERYLAYKRPNVTIGTYASLCNKINLFVRIITEYNDGKDISSSALKKESIRHYRDTLKQFPVQRKDLPDTYSIKELISLGRKTISSKTLSDSTVYIGDFLNWIEDEGYAIEKDLRRILRTASKNKNTDKKKRECFKNEELKRLFESDQYQKGLFTRSSDYWVPLLALFTGARMGELLQLHIKDIREESGAWVFDINTEDEKSVKTISGVRLVPIHSQLIKMGFLDFVKEMEKKSDRLFPDEIRTNQGKFRAYTGRFHTYRNKVGVTTPDKSRLDFHSFRHTVRTKLTETGIDETLIDDIIGHSGARSIGRSTYNHSQLIPQKQKAIEALNYEIQFELIRPWNKNKLVRTVTVPNRTIRRKRASKA